jgi:hypothetical protein
LAASAYAVTPPSTHADDPGRSVSRADTSPPVHDSAVATVQPRSANAPATRSSTVGPVLNTVCPKSACTAAASRPYAGAAAGPNRVTISSSPSRRQVVISRPVSSSATRRSVAASSDSRVPHSRSVSWDSSVAPASTARTRSDATAAGHIPCSSEGGPGRTTTGGPDRPSATGTTSPGAVPTGSSTVAPAGTRACLATPAAVAAGSARHPRRAISAATIPPMRSSRAGSTADGRPWASPTTCAVRSSAVGPRPPVVTTRSAPPPARKASADRRSSGRSPTVTTAATSTPRVRSCSASHGPFRSGTRPVRTSVPVTTMPARTATRRP